MSGFVVLDVFIGLIFIYVLYSLFATIILEFYSSFFSLRGRNLEWALNRMLLDQKENIGISRLKIIAAVVTLWNSLVRIFYFPRKGLVEKFYNHPNIKYLSEGGINNRPAYIKNETFSWTLMDILKEGPGKSYVDNIEANLVNGNPLNIDNDTKELLSKFWRDSNQDLVKFKSFIADWFENTNERAAGWYKQNIQFLLLIIGLVLAILFRLDTIELAKKLATDKAVREQTVQLAIAYIENKGDSVEYKKMQGSLNRDMQGVNNLIGTGWGDQCISSIICAVLSSYSGLGYLLTALAISLGAPFWFDLLNKFVKLRSSVQAVGQSSPGGNQTATSNTPLVGGAIPARQRKG